MMYIRAPVHVMGRILEILADNGGVIKDSELFEKLRMELDLSYSDMLKYLMILEIRGYVSVNYSKENVRIISLTRYGKEHLGARLR